MKCVKTARQRSLIHLGQNSAAMTPCPCYLNLSKKTKGENVPPEKYELNKSGMEESITARQI